MQPKSLELLSHMLSWQLNYYNHGYTHISRVDKLCDTFNNVNNNKVVDMANKFDLLVDSDASETTEILDHIKQFLISGFNSAHGNDSGHDAEINILYIDIHASLIINALLLECLNIDMSNNDANIYAEVLFKILPHINTYWCKWLKNLLHFDGSCSDAVRILFSPNNTNVSNEFIIKNNRERFEELDPSNFVEHCELYKQLILSTSVLSASDLQMPVKRGISWSASGSILAMQESCNNDEDFKNMIKQRIDLLEVMQKHCDKNTIANLLSYKLRLYKQYVQLLNDDELRSLIYNMSTFLTSNEKYEDDKALRGHIVDGHALNAAVTCKAQEYNRRLIEYLYKILNERCLKPLTVRELIDLESQSSSRKPEKLKL